MLLQLSHFPPPSLHSSLPTPSLPNSPPIVHVHGSYLKVLWLLHFLYYSYLPPCLFSTYHLCYLFSVTFLPFSPPLTTDNPPCDFHFCDYVPILVVCLVFYFVFVFLGSLVDSWEFVVILLFIVLIIFFFLDKSL